MAEEEEVRPTAIGDDATAASYDDRPESLTSTLARAVSLTSTSPIDAVRTLRSLQDRIASLSLFSSNETIDDVTTSSLPLLATDHHLAVAHLALSAPSGSERKSNVLRSTELFHGYLRRMEALGGLDEEVVKDYHALLDLEESDGGVGGDDGRPTRTRLTAGQARDAKVARYRLKKAAEEETARLEALEQRRGRLNADPAEEMDGYDGDGLARKSALLNLKVLAVEALEEIYSADRELEMLEMAVEMERRREKMQRHTGNGQADFTSTNRDPRNQPPGEPRPPSNKPLQLTHITQDPTTGQLRMRKEEVRSQVFRPGWNQPTMTLRELGDIERDRAIERSERQAAAEAEARGLPRRYDQLERDGMEDDADLVDASARLDREWDRFKEENPRGSGNKMGDVGDRNF